MARGNHRRTIKSAGRETANGGGMQPVSQQAARSTDGVFMRMPVGLRYSTTVKSKLAPRTIRGIEPPGFQPRNYPSPEF